MQKSKLNIQKLNNDISEALCVGPLSEVQERIKTVATAITYDHELTVRHYCVALANIALAIIKDAPDTIWLTSTQTVVEYVCEELGIEHENMEQSLKEFVQFEPKAKELWQDPKKELKSENPDQLELCLQSKKL